MEGSVSAKVNRWLNTIEAMRTKYDWNSCIKLVSALHKKIPVY
jgi:hypothetical protein